jgi:nucleoside-diphosphate-sugar epimerase
VLEACRRGGTRHLVYASSNSVHGASERYASNAHGPAEHPVNLYDATDLERDLGVRPSVPAEEGLHHLARWHLAWRRPGNAAGPRAA